MVTATRTSIDNVVAWLLKTARAAFDTGSDRTDALASALREHDQVLTREVLLHLAFAGLGTLFDAETKAIGMGASKKFAEFTGGSAIGPRSTGFGEAISAGFVSEAVRFAKTKSLFGIKLYDTDLAFMQSVAGRTSSQVNGWTLTDEAVKASLPLYQKYGRFAAMTPEAQAEVARLIADADNARKGTPLEEV